MDLQDPQPGYVFTFAYGSNMCLGRMRCRVPSACPVAVAQLTRYRFAFHKVSTSRSGPRSGKGGAYHAGYANDRVVGVVFRLRDDQKHWLDAAEGVDEGYEVQDLVVDEVNGRRRFTARTYVAMVGFINRDLRPFSWYKRHVVEGAAYFKLDPAYIAHINQFETIEDTVRWRIKREAGYPYDSDVSVAAWQQQRCNGSGPEPCE
jgi:gamma-glutamylcyclotransferase